MGGLQAFVSAELRTQSEIWLSQHYHWNRGRVACGGFCAPIGVSSLSLLVRACSTLCHLELEWWWTLNLPFLNALNKLSVGSCAALLLWRAHWATLSTTAPSCKRAFRVLVWVSCVVLNPYLYKTYLNQAWSGHLHCPGQQLISDNLYEWSFKQSCKRSVWAEIEVCTCMVT